MKRPKLAIADPRPIFIKGLKSILEQNGEFTTIIQENSLKKVLKKVKQIHCDILIVSNDLKDFNETILTKFKKGKTHKPYILVCFKTLEKRQALKLLNHGINGLISVNWPTLKLKDSVKQVLLDGFVHNDAILDIAKDDRSEEQHLNITDRKNWRGEFKFTRRQKEVISLIRIGLSYEKIADKLCISKRTVEYHFNEIMQKTNTNNVAHLVIVLFEHGVFKLERDEH